MSDLAALSGAVATGNRVKAKRLMQALVDADAKPATILDEGLVPGVAVMPFGTTRQIEEAIEQYAVFVLQGDSIIVAPTHVLEPDVPWTNIAALAGATEKVRLI